MSSASPSRPDSAVSLQDMEISRLKEEIEQLRFSEQAVKQECEEWKRKHRDQKLEVSRLSGVSSKEGRRVKSIEDRCSELEAQLAGRTSELTRLREDLSKAQECIRDTELRNETAEDVSRRGRSAIAELDSVRSQLNDLQQDHSQLQKAYEDCAVSAQQAADKIANAEQMQRAAEEEMQACRHLHEANRLTQEQTLLVKKQLLEATRALRISEADVSELEKAVEINRVDKMSAEDRVTELEADLHLWKPQHDSRDAFPDAPECGPCSNSKPAKDTSEVAEPDAFGGVVSGLTANIIININPADQNHRTLLQRVQSAISKSAKLDVTGPPDLVADFLAEMQRLEADHAEQTTAAAHWQKVALKCLAEIDSLSAKLQGRPMCGVHGHRSLADELEARNLQLQLQATLLAEWQRKIVAARGYFEASNEEMRDSGIQGI